MQPDTAGKKLGPIWLTPGIGYGNAAAGIYASFTTIGLLIYLGFVQPYLLTEVLNIPQTEQGSVTGRLASLTEVVQIIAMSAIGALSDQWGRRVFLCAWFCLFRNRLFSLSARQFCYAAHYIPADICSRCSQHSDDALCHRH